MRSRDGRRIAVQESGNPSGHPVFLLHGTPGSRIGPLPRHIRLYKLGVRLITFDRPGYGWSDPGQVGGLLDAPAKTMEKLAHPVVKITVLFLWLPWGLCA